MLKMTDSFWYKSAARDEPADTISVTEEEEGDDADVVAEAREARRSRSVRTRRVVVMRFCFRFIAKDGRAWWVKKEGGGKERRC